MSLKTNKQLKKRILEISYKQNLSHISSCLTAVDIIAEIYAQKHTDAKFVLSAGHAHLAHLVVMEHYGLVNAEEMLMSKGIHCDRVAGCDVSTGSLGMGLPIAVGMALADRSRYVYCLVSDGELSEGSIWEALRIMKEQNLRNLHLYINFNGWAAYKKTDYAYIKSLLMQHTGLNINLILTDVSEIEFLRGQKGHYVTMSHEQYERLQETLK